MKLGGKHLVVTGLLTGLLLSMAAPAFAATPGQNNQESIAISPVNKFYKFKPGSTNKDEITVTNGGTVDYKFKLYVSPYSVNGVEYKPDFFTKKKNTDLNEWVTFAKSTYELKAGQAVTVPYTVSVPENAIPGGHYGVIFAETQPSDERRESNSVERKKRVGALVYATVEGDFETGGKFNGIRTPGLQFKAPLKSELNVENTGSSDFSVETVFAVSDIFGSRKYTDTKKYQILPQTERLINLSWDKSPGFGLYQVTVSAKFLDQQTSKTSYVLMAPIAFYMIFIVGLLVAVIYFVQKRR